MRVIAGKAKSIPLIVPKGLDTRPTTDRIKETLFNIIHHDMPGCRFLDLFSGSGAIGIEALSRGAKSCLFIERDAKCISCIHANLEKTKLSDRARVVRGDVTLALHQLGESEPFDYIFMDPPYGANIEEEVLHIIAGSEIANKDTTIIIEASLQTTTDFLKFVPFELIRTKTYKTNQHFFLKMKPEGIIKK